SRLLDSLFQGRGRQDGERRVRPGRQRLREGRRQARPGRLGDGGRRPARNPPRRVGRHADRRLLQAPEGLRKARGKRQKAKVKTEVATPRFSFLPFASCLLPLLALVRRLVLALY